MAELLATMPVLPLGSDCRVQFEAINPTTGAAVSGVTVSLATIYAVDVQGDDAVIGNLGPYMLVPGPATVAAPADKKTVTRIG